MVFVNLRNRRSRPATLPRPQPCTKLGRTRSNLIHPPEVVMKYTLTRTVTVALVAMCLLYTPAAGGGRRGTFSAGAVRLETQTDVVLLSDSFDRADSPQPGAPWVEAGE